jgi:hypothetical protein
MISVDPPSRECFLLQKRMAAKETTAYYFELPGSPFIFQYHNDGTGLFGAIADKRGNCLKYLPKIELN